MNSQLVIASAHGIRRAHKNKKTWQEESTDLIQHTFTAIARQGRSVLAGTKNGLYLSLNNGNTWQPANEGLTHRHIRALHFHPEESKIAFAGTEPAAIFITRDGGLSWQECPEVGRLREKYNWSLPYSPKAGCVRDFAFKKQRAYAAVEQGGLLRSNDGGRSWHLIDSREDDSRVISQKPWIHRDVHSVEIHPSSPDQVFSPTGGGLYYSTSGGRSWSQLHHAYCRAVWVDPIRPGTMILGPADGPDRNGCIEASYDGGNTWIKAMDGLDIQWSQFMVEQFLSIEGELLAVLSNGSLISTAIDSMKWDPNQTLGDNIIAITG